MTDQLFPIRPQPIGADQPILIIEPYKVGEAWVFDDSIVGLCQEPFVAGITEMIDRLSAKIPNAVEGFRLLFSDHRFEGHQVTLTWVRADPIEGNWYRADDTQVEGWLCPALFLYFQPPPEKIYVRAEPKLDGTHR